MEDRPASGTPVIVAAAAVALVGVATIAIRPYDPHGGRQLVDGFLLASFIGAAALALARHRDSQDPHALFVATGLAIVAAQIAILAGYSTAVGGPTSPAWEGRPLPSLAWHWAWLLAAICLLLALPWWERRGRPPIRPLPVLAAGAIALVAGDGVLAIARKSFGTVTESALRQDAAFAHATWLHWTLAAAAAGALLAAGHRERRAGKLLRSPHAWVAAATMPAAAAQLCYLAWPVQFRPLLIPGGVLPAVAAGLTFAGLIVADRAETSRMRRATDRAEQITSGRAEIAATIAHELRGPVTTVKGLATTGSHHYDSLSEADRKEFFDLIHQEAARLLHIVDETSIAMKIDARTIAYDIRPEDLETVARGGLDKAAAGAHPMELDFEPDLRVALDRLRLTETVTQLVDNAAKFSPAAAAITVRTRSDGGRAFIEVGDRGPGFAPEHRDAAFERFARFRPKGYEEVPGSGLGLFICRAHVSAHGGRITIEERHEGGTMLVVDLPMEGNA